MAKSQANIITIWTSVENSKNGQIIEREYYCQKCGEPLTSGDGKITSTIPGSSPKSPQHKVRCQGTVVVLTFNDHIKMWGKNAYDYRVKYGQINKAKELRMSLNELKENPELRYISFGEIKKEVVDCNTEYVFMGEVYIDNPVFGYI